MQSLLQVTLYSNKSLARTLTRGRFGQAHVQTSVLDNTRNALKNQKKKKITYL
jgi:hypothetical protein